MDETLDIGGKFGRRLSRNNIISYVYSVVSRCDISLMRLNLVVIVLTYVDHTTHCHSFQGV